jgi:hypothetical protein
MAKAARGSTSENRENVMSIPGLPEPPVIDDETIESCRANDDFRPAMFEWYKHVGLLALSFASVKDAGALRSMVPRNFAALIGLLLRCSKLMRSVLMLSADRGGRGESTSILHRSIVESTVKLRWLCQTGTEERFARFVADGLKTELYLREDIDARIAERGHAINIEKRMLHPSRVQSNNRESPKRKYGRHRSCQTTRQCCANLEMTR